MINVKNGLLYQWDINRKIEVDDELNQVTEIHFCCEGDEEALIVPFSRKGEKIEATVPNILLQSTEKIYVFTVNSDNSEVKTTDYRVLHVIPRQKPSDYTYEETEVFKYKNLEQKMLIELAGKADIDSTGKIIAAQLPEGLLTQDNLNAAIDAAITQAKESGELDGEKGEDGISATHEWNGTTLIVTSASGTSSADLKGEKGDKGDKGATGAAGADGYTPVKGTDYFTESDINEIVDAVYAIVADGNEVAY